ncbi:MAG: CHAT domain-containing protein [Acidobacteria bacterium]|nr:CHAT domain-containing protein [Acidobacteriota bacterium]
MPSRYVPHLLLARSGGDEDGLLEAREVMKLGLKARLAVLSACETARGISDRAKV